MCRISMRLLYRRLLIFQLLQISCRRALACCREHLYIFYLNRIKNLWVFFYVSPQLNNNKFNLPLRLQVAVNNVNVTWTSSSSVPWVTSLALLCTFLTLNLLVQVSPQAPWTFNQIVLQVVFKLSSNRTVAFKDLILAQLRLKEFKLSAQI
jgi:hypothetical protein